MESKGSEIVLLACGILALVAIMSVVLWRGHRERREERRASGESQSSHGAHSQGRECLFQEVFAAHPDHGSPLISLHDNDADPPSFIATVRKRSQTLAGAVQHELADLRHDLETESLGSDFPSLLDDEAAVELLDESRTTTELARHHPDTETDAGHIVSGDARRRTSSGVKTERLKTRKSQELSLCEHEMG